MSDDYDVTIASRTKAILLGAWVVLTHTALTIVARVGGCGESQRFEAALLPKLLDDTSACQGTELAGASIRLAPRLHDGALFGLGAGIFEGFLGQVYALGLVLLATVVTILVSRWQGRSTGDGQALALIWAGALTGAIPRLVGSGRGLSELDLFGLHTGIGELALVWGAVWLATRAIAEGRG